MGAPSLNYKARLATARLGEARLAPTRLRKAKLASARLGNKSEQKPRFILKHVLTRSKDLKYIFSRDIHSRLHEKNA